jgi:peptidoglycan hydrolase-like protein with peptidoglycan-binding domain
MQKRSAAAHRPPVAPPASRGRKKSVSNAARQQQLQGKGGAEVGPAEDSTEVAADRLAHLVMKQVAAAPPDDGGAGDPAAGPLPEALLAAFQAATGHDVSQIPLTVGGVADQEAAGLGALGFARDGQAFVSSSVGDLSSEAGMAVAAHELAHVVLGHATSGQPVRRHATGQVLRRGDRGAAVSSLQDRLVSLGYLTAAEKASGPGVFGPRTHSAVVSFQAAQGLSRDGIVGPGTQAALQSAASSRSAAAAGGDSGGTVRYGARGATVQAVQEQLVSLGYLTQAQMDSGPGVFGRQTLRAVWAFQADQRLSADGIVGAQTRAALSTAAQSRGSSAADTGSSGARSGASLTGSPPLRQGNEGVLVKALQRMLNQHGGTLTIDGEFGAATLRAVRAFQGANGISVDGIVGPGTAGALTGGSATSFTLGSSTESGTTDGVAGSVDVNVDDADPKGVLSQSSLNPTVKSLAARTVRTLQEQGYSPYIFEGHRTMQRQNDLYARGRTTGGQKVTFVRGGGSWHNYGLAVDIVFWDRSHTSPSWGAPSSHWQALGRAGKGAGFTRWMGDSGWDFAHFEHHPDWGNSCSNLLNTYNESGFSGVWGAVGA